MPTITVKNIPPDVYERLRESAAANHRSLNSEIIVCIEQGVRGHKLNVEDFLVRARRLRLKTETVPITDAALRAAKHAGRP